MLPIEIIKNIYYYCDIETKIILHKQYNLGKGVLTKKKYILLENVYKLKWLRYCLLKELSLQHFLKTNIYII